MLRHEEGVEQALTMHADHHVRLAAIDQVGLEIPATKHNTARAQHVCACHVHQQMAPQHEAFSSAPDSGWYSCNAAADYAHSACRKSTCQLSKVPSSNMSSWTQQSFTHLPNSCSRQAVPFQSCTPCGGLNLRHHDHTWGSAQIT